MTTLDVTEILHDPDFITRGLVRSRAEVTTLVKGRPVPQALEVHSFVGVVVPDDGKTFARAPETTDILDARLIYTTTDLRPGDEETNAGADVVTLPSEGEYTVRNVKPYRIGRGFVVALVEKKRGGNA